MESKNIKILIIKSDKIGDFINFSPCLKILKDNIKKSHITLICSEYSYPIVKNYEYIDKLIVFRNKFMIINLLRNFKNLLTVKYNYLFQFDGKNSSYLIAYFVRAKLKSAICYIKKKKIFGIKYFKYRPNKFLLKSFKNHAFCPEDYSEFSHYQSNYIKLLENLNFNISAKKNLFSLDKSFESTFKK